MDIPILEWMFETDTWDYRYGNRTLPTLLGTTVMGIERYTTAHIRTPMNSQAQSLLCCRRMYVSHVEGFGLYFTVVGFSLSLLVELYVSLPIHDIMINHGWKDGRER
jgi:hypothetical protein